MNKIYDHKKVEANIDKKWVQKKFFMTHDQSKKPFSILLPPPNVTGKLHLGHALDVYIQDTIIRYKKLKGFDVMWLPGMDHAGIATQSKVEDVLYQTSGLTRHDLGREKFIDKIWEWKDQYAQVFKNQWSKVGLALDYSKERFTLDKKANQAVNKVFIDLYKKGFIYRGVRAINWDIKLQTALSNIEVNNQPTPQKMYYINYQLENSNNYLTIATVRTETLLSDVALVCHPKDKRYVQFLGQNVIHPLTGKIIPVLASDYVDPEFGTGVMKLSAHAEADIEIIQKLNLQIVETIDKNGFINAPDSQFNKMERFQAREAIAQYLQEHNKIARVEETISNVGYSERSKTPVEILVLPQWFVKMDHFAKLILDELDTTKAVKFCPKRFKSTLKKWIQNVHDWNISRQLWWGHRIPAWYDAHGNIKVQEKSPGKQWTQDPDVLDTWFSSGIAPFSFLNWPKSNSDLARFYPFSLLVTGYDLIFFWVARMYFFGKEFMQEKPFKHLLFHGLIRDQHGQKMSKSLNNGVDPMDLINEYGSDALRWFLITNTSPGMDIKFSTEKLQSAWRVNNKLWNIANFINSLNDDNKVKSDADYWINHKLALLNREINKAMQNYDFAIVGSKIQHYLFNDLSGWYIEMIKNNPSKKHALEILRKTLIILHPFMPFITDRIYSELFNAELLENLIPMIRTNKQTQYIDIIIEIVTQIRKYREQNQISKKEIINYHTEKPLDQHTIQIINSMAYANNVPNQDFLISLSDNNLFIQMQASLKEKNRQLLLEKIHFTQSEIERAQTILSNANFVAKAPKEKVQAEKDKLNKYNEELAKYQEELKCKY
ncbi:valine--tRNA ligase [Mycoplasma sp. 1578d]|uniref:valine--tRNA ligase n=1 Tax=Mycoplasma sp. 1578d TaxID=2967299 RepID=UPI00211D0EB7|nr:valine--tRNA ligase [Mycoplasma sp. 1578d]UUM20059.1 valine--tRNA ligase [Mycoplasma sp. 1578d]